MLALLVPPWVSAARHTSRSGSRLFCIITKKLRCEPRHTGINFRPVPGGKTGGLRSRGKNAPWTFGRLGTFGSLEQAALFGYAGPQAGIGSADVTNQMDTT